jgi:hypothetical protein
MSAPTWEDIRGAIATKCFSAAMRTAGVRRADTDTDEIEPLPHILIGPVTYALDEEGQPDGWQESYTLSVSGELLVARPAGRKRSEPVVSTIGRALQIEWRSTITMGLSGVTWSKFVGLTPGLQLYADTGLDGAGLAWLVYVHEILTTMRT